jgi:hypothetical protein
VIDPRIALAGTPVNIPQPDFLRTLQGASNLQSEQQQRFLRQISLQQMLEGEQRERALRDYVARVSGGVPGLPGTAPVPQSPGGVPINPTNPQVAAGPITEGPLGPMQPPAPGQGVPAPAPGPNAPPAAAPTLAQAQPGREQWNPMTAYGIAGNAALPLIQAERQGRHEEMVAQATKMKTFVAGIQALDEALPFIQDQQSLDAAIEKFGPAGSVLPQVYSKEAMDAVYQRLQMAKQQAAQMQMKTGLTPIYGTQGGKTTFVLPTQAGTVVQPTLPPGFQVAPQAQAINLGTREVLIDKRTGQPISQYPIEVRQKEAEEARGKEEAAKPQKKREALTLMERIDAKHDDITKWIEEIKVLKKEAKLPTTGALGPWMAQFGGTNARTIANRLRSIVNNLGLDELTGLKAMGVGLGSVTEAEHEMLRKIQTTVDQGDFGPRFLDDLDELAKALKRNRTLRKQAFDRDFADTPTQTPAAPQTPGGTSRQGAPVGVVTDEDIDATLQNPLNEGKTRQNIIDAFRARGYRVPGD